MTSEQLTVLAVESSCDETAVAIVRNGVEILANSVASQIELHRRYGGVFPEMASRHHVTAVTPVLDEALATAGLGWDDIDAVAATQGPGLAGSLVVGLNFAKGLALGRALPFIGINHLEGHIYSNWLHTPGEPEVVPRFPALILIVSGGHTELIVMREHGQYDLIGRTLDDAAGEAFDKVARLLGLPYPGGPPLERAATEGRAGAFSFPRSTPNEYDFSFSGLKSAVLREVERIQPPREGRGGGLGPAVVKPLPVADLAASFQAAVVDVLVDRVQRAADTLEFQQFLLAGGVAANQSLRGALDEALADRGIPAHAPPLALCTDNAAAIAAAAYWRLKAGERSSWAIDIEPGMALVPAGA